MSSLNIRCPTELYSCSSAADRRRYCWYAGCLLDNSRRLCQDSTSSRATGWCHSLQGSHRRSDYHPQGRGLPSPFQGRYCPSHSIESPIRSVSERCAVSCSLSPSDILSARLQDSCLLRNAQEEPSRELHGWLCLSREHVADQTSRYHLVPLRPGGSKGRSCNRSDGQHGPVSCSCQERFEGEFISIIGRSG